MSAYVITKQDAKQWCVRIHCDQSEISPGRKDIGFGAQRRAKNFEKGFHAYEARLYAKEAFPDTLFKNITFLITSKRNLWSKVETLN